MDLEMYRDIPPWEWPPDSGKLFLNVLTDNSARESDRIIAAELAADTTVVDEALTNALITILSSPDQSEPLRARSALSLGPVLELADEGEFGDNDLDKVPVSETTFENMMDRLKIVYLDESTPKEVRRRILEASVRAPQNWQKDAISKAYATGDREWVLTAVFAMNYIRGFDKEILESLKSTSEDIRSHAITAAGNWEITTAWPQVKPLFTGYQTPKPLLLAAIDAVFGICPEEAEAILHKLAASEDEEISEAAEEALLIGAPMDDEDFDSAADEPPKWVN